jgi:hypothetical protein
LRARSASRALLVPLLLVVLPLAAYALLLAALSHSGAAGVMLGAVSGRSIPAVVSTLAALLLRLYTVVVLPPAIVAWLAARLLLGKRGG